LAWHALTEVLLALQMVLVELLALPAVPELFAAGVGNGGIGADGEVEWMYWPMQLGTVAQQQGEVPKPKALVVFLLILHAVFF